MRFEKMRLRKRWDSKKTLCPPDLWTIPTCLVHALACQVPGLCLQIGRGPVYPQSGGFVWDTGHKKGYFTHAFFEMCA